MDYEEIQEAAANVFEGIEDGMRQAATALVQFTKSIERLSLACAAFYKSNNWRKLHGLPMRRKH